MASGEGDAVAALLFRLIGEFWSQTERRQRSADYV